MASPGYEPLPNLSSPAPASPAADGATTTFGTDYNAGNTYGLAEPETGLQRGAVTGIAIGCVLGGLLIGALLTLCWLKRRRLFPDRFGPPKHPHEAAPVGPLDVLRSGSKLDTLNKEQLGNPKSFAGRSHGPPDVVIHSQH